MNEDEKKELEKLRRERIELMENEIKRLKGMVIDLTKISSNMLDRLEIPEEEKIENEIDEEINRIYG